MAINRNSNAFTFLFAIIMVLIVGAALSFASMSLKPLQVQNTIEKEMMSILGSVGVESTRDNAEGNFYEYITNRIVLNHQGEVVEERDGKIDADDKNEPFNVDVKKEFRDRQMTNEKKHYPLYVANIDGEKVVVIPMVGKGLWGPVWGYVALKSDYNTIYGATFNHQSETPGLGAEITEPFFTNEFAGKTIYDEQGKLVSIEVQKGGASPDAPHAVDAITGGTITSKGVQEMLERTFSVYDKYFEKNRTQTSQEI
ncbi:NADH:ubiquinone reductase (Na(+)-transporting) subunit C [Cryomorpha ignava]|uniref:NADH:ubiquinone reductase (Na(+)-transporting) subunit C n=1 Tax=Cryomorpha ignava TaxID=101383 RepID=UPI0019537818|nr:NADH:ubiquinone reductase (Na(+)-transporting) subunit C [Cryomorpha ignava]